MMASSITTYAALQIPILAIHSWIAMDAPSTVSHIPALYLSGERSPF
jgi:hypothetical protein